MSKILVVEDDQMLLSMYKEKLEIEHMQVLSANNGEEGLQSALANKPDLILLDFAMPKMDGLQMMKQLRMDPWGNKVPIIALTNLNIDGKMLEEVNKFKPVYCLLKSNITPEGVLTKINELLKNEPTPQPAS